ALWAEAETALDKVAGLARAAGLQQRLQEARKNLRLVKRLDDIRLAGTPIGGGKFNYTTTAAAYAAVFREHGFDLLSSRTRLRIMIHDPHPTRRCYPHRTPPAAPYRPVADSARPLGDGVARRCRLVGPAHRRPPRLPPPHGPRGPALVCPTGGRWLQPT